MTDAGLEGDRGLAESPAGVDHPAAAAVRVQGATAFGVRPAPLANRCRRPATLRSRTAPVGVVGTRSSAAAALAPPPGPAFEIARPAADRARSPAVGDCPPTRPAACWNPASRWWGKGTGDVPLAIDVVAESVDERHLLVRGVKWSRRDDAASIRRELAGEGTTAADSSRAERALRALAETQWLGKCRRYAHDRSGSNAGHRPAQDLSYLSCWRRA